MRDRSMKAGDIGIKNPGLKSIKSRKYLSGNTRKQVTGYDTTDAGVQLVEP